MLLYLDILNELLVENLLGKDLLHNFVAVVHPGD